MKILLVEDDALLSSGLMELLEEAGHAVRLAEDGPAAAALGISEAFDLLLLDLMLPGFDGLEVCRRIRTARPGIPALMLTARGHENDKIQGLREGVDDYMVKPFSARELLARITAVRRRLRQVPAEPEVLQLEDRLIDLGRCTVSRAEDTLATLTPKEVGILRLLRRHRARAVTRSELLEEVWGVPGHLATRTVDMAVLGLRQKIEADPKAPKTVLSVTGVGYAWGGPDAEGTSPEE